MLVSVSSTKLLGVDNASRNAGAAVVQWPDRLNADHVWALTATG